MVYDYEINGIPVQTGDLICTTDGGADNMKGQFWRLIGMCGVRSFQAVRELDKNEYVIEWAMIK